jgi:hypothetical protein
MSGQITLDHCAVVFAAFNLRGQPGHPLIKCDIAWGTRDQSGAFAAYSFSDPATVEAHFIEHERAPKFLGAAKKAHKNPPRGKHLLEAFALWLEEELVAEGKFGRSAEVIEQEGACGESK